MGWGGGVSQPCFWGRRAWWGSTWGSGQSISSLTCPCVTSVGMRCGWKDRKMRDCDLLWQERLASKAEATSRQGPLPLISPPGSTLTTLRSGSHLGPGRAVNRLMHLELLEEPSPYSFHRATFPNIVAWSPLYIRKHAAQGCKKRKKGYRLSYCPSLLVRSNIYVQLGRQVQWFNVIYCRKGALIRHCWHGRDGEMLEGQQESWVWFSVDTSPVQISILVGI